MSDSEDDVPLGQRLVTNPVNGGSAPPAAPATIQPVLIDKRPAATKVPETSGEAKAKTGMARVIPKKNGVGSARATAGVVETKTSSLGKAKVVSKAKTSPAAHVKARTVTPTSKAKPTDASQKRPLPSSSSSSDSSSGSDSSDDSSDSDSSDSDDDEPLSKRAKSKTSQSLAVRASSAKAKSSAAKTSKKVVKKAVKKAARKESSSGGGTSSSSKRLWETLEHMGVLFPPPYEPHGVKLKYAGKPVDLTAEEEEVASMFATMKDTDYATKPVFVKNFWNDFVNILTPANKKILKEMQHCDFTDIYLYQLEQKEIKKNMSKEQKLAIKANREEEDIPFHYATIDGRQERVGNFRVEPPGLFRGRGEHPKMGKLKARIMPRDVTINIGEHDRVPPCPVPGHNWGEVIHNHNATWLAGWNDSINTKDRKYVQFAAQSSIKGDSDLKKYEKARKLKLYIEKIRVDYRKGWESQDKRVQQMSVAVYLIDKLALRAGGEKDDDLADTVGCCTLRVGHLTFIEPASVRLDFLGKDSIRFDQTTEVEVMVFKSLKRMCKGKKEEDDLFDLIEPTVVNSHLQGLMEGLTIKVFRTYNASITLDKLLQETKEATLQQKKAQYDAANKEVAILCNHQKGASKAHDAQMAVMLEKKDAMEEELKALREEPRSDKTAKKIAALQDRFSKAELNMNMKEELKTVSLGTSKINYLDPRITIAWCKLWEVPLTTVFTKALLEKFNWAMEVEPEFRF